MRSLTFEQWSRPPSRLDFDPKTIAYARSEFGPLGLADTFLELYPADGDAAAAQQYSA
ncbi:hypothetical protein ABTY98_02715 [Streptomyces sp. NPDC096040]|uniref:hypothetical protein n=1 Tax=Streptomyces sp. NPDC096040 TaxID=3155541 RepID=UPI00332CBFF6